LKEPEEPIPEILRRVKRVYLCRTYGVEKWKDAHEFLSEIAKKYGKLLKGGEPDTTSIAKMVLNDWIRGKVPFYTEPPALEGDEAAKSVCSC